MVLTKTARAANKENAHVSKSKATLIGRGASLDARIARKRVPRPYLTCSVPKDIVRTVSSAFVDGLFNCAQFGDVEGNGATRVLTLPRRLRRPAYRGINHTALAAVDSAIADVPLEYLQNQLRLHGNQMYATITRMNVHQPLEVPSLQRMKLKVDPEQDPSFLPTHAFAVYSDRVTTSDKQKVSLMLAHSLIYATQCANLPSLPSPSADLDVEEETADLRVFPLRIPSLRTFPLVHRYLYTHRTEDLLSILLPIPSQVAGPEELSQKLAASNSLDRIIELIAVVQGVWSNVSALGIFDEAIWASIDYAWTSLLVALEIKTKEKDEY